MPNKEDKEAYHRATEEQGNK